MDSFINLEFLKIKGNKEGKSFHKKNEHEESLSGFSDAFYLNDNIENSRVNLNKEGLDLDQIVSKNKKTKGFISKSDDKSIDVAVISPPNPSENKTIHLSKGIIQDDMTMKLQAQNTASLSKKNTKLDKTISDINKENKSAENQNQLLNLHNKKNNLYIKTGLEKVQINDANNVFSHVQDRNKKRINTFFKNYVNYKNRKGIKSNLKMVKLALMTKIRSLQKHNMNDYKIDTLKNDNFEGKENNIPNQSTEISKKIFTSGNNRESYLLLDKANLVDDSNRLIKITESLNQNKDLGFDRLKNILDIKSTDVNERLLNIFEKNLKTGNNSFEIQIMPENLGKIQITVEMLNDNNVDINIRAESSNSIQLINENNTNLQKMLQNNGINLNNFNLNNNQNKNFSNNHSKNTKKVDEEEAIVESNKTQHGQQGKKNNLVYIKA